MNTNNLAEASFRRIKDYVLKRNKCINAVELFQYMSIALEKNFKQTMLGKVFAYKLRMSKAQLAMEKKGKAIPSANISKVPDSENTYSVVSNGNLYYVQTKLGVSTCFVGNTGAYCKHQVAVSEKMS